LTHNRIGPIFRDALRMPCPSRNRVALDTVAMSLIAPTLDALSPSG
jgi:hypothetical protein